MPLRMTSGYFRRIDLAISYIIIYEFINIYNDGKKKKILCQGCIYLTKNTVKTNYLCKIINKIANLIAIAMCRECWSWVILASPVQKKQAKTGYPFPDGLNVINTWTEAWTSFDRNYFVYPGPNLQKILVCFTLTCFHVYLTKLYKTYTFCIYQLNKNDSWKREREIVNINIQLWASLTQSHFIIFYK